MTDKQNNQELMDELKLMKDKEEQLKLKRKEYQKKYNLSEKGKAARKRTYKKNYKPTGNKRGRPAKL
tara:strand:+ start:269 stop:469 length:201 start_codon:yes stop_codon:yes gene_type:complete